MKKLILILIATLSVSSCATIDDSRSYTSEDSVKKYEDVLKAEKENTTSVTYLKDIKPIEMMLY